MKRLHPLEILVDALRKEAEREESKCRLCPKFSWDDGHARGRAEGLADAARRFDQMLKELLPGRSHG